MFKKDEFTIVALAFGLVLFFVIKSKINPSKYTLSNSAISSYHSDYIAKEIPNFVIKNAAGDTLNIQSVLTSRTALFFLSSECKACIQLAEYLINLAEEFQPHLEFIALFMRIPDSLTINTNRLSPLKSYVIEPTVFIDFDIHKIPHYIIVDENKVIQISEPIETVDQIAAHCTAF